MSAEYVTRQGKNPSFVDLKYPDKRFSQTTEFLVTKVGRPERLSLGTRHGEPDLAQKVDRADGEENKRTPTIKGWVGEHKQYIPTHDQVEGTYRKIHVSGRGLDTPKTLNRRW